MLSFGIPPRSGRPVGPDQPVYVCDRATAPPRIDGRLDEPDWALVPWSGDFLDIRGLQGPTPPLRTRRPMPPAMSAPRAVYPILTVDQLDGGGGCISTQTLWFTSPNAFRADTR